MKRGWNKISSWSHKTWAGKHICILSSNLKLDELSGSSFSSLTKHLKCVISVLLTYCLWAPCCSSLFCSLLLRLYSPASPWSSTKDEVGTGCSRELLSLAEDDWLPSVTSTRMVLLGPSWLQMPFWQVSWWPCDFSTAKGCPQPQRNGCKQHVAEPAYLKS